MKNVVDFPDSAAIDDEAAAWLVRLDSEEPLSDEERALLAEWLHRSPAHRERLTELAALWEKLNALTELAVPLASPGESKRRLAGKRTPLLSGAALSVAVLAAFVVYSLFQPAPITATNGLYSSAIGEQRATSLADGSEIFLNTNSQIRVDFDEDYRDIRLMQGEALFVVAEDRARRFRVFAGGGRIEAVGTAFSVYLKDDSVDITVTEGEVTLATATRAAVSDPDTRSQIDAPAASAELGSLRAGQIATLPRLDEPSLDTAATLPQRRSVREQEMSRRMSWTDGKLTFAGDPLEHVVGEISRYTTVKIEFADPEVRAIRVGGTFPVGETGAMFDALERTFGLEVTYLSANRVRISAGD